MREGVKMRRCEDEKMRYRPPLSGTKSVQEKAAGLPPFVTFHFLNQD